MASENPSTPPVEFEMLDYLCPGFRDVDFTQKTVRLKFIFGSCSLFIGLYVVLHFVSSMTRTYRKLKTKEKIFWNLAIVRAVFGIFGGSIGAWAVFTSTALDTDRVFGINQTSYVAICTTIGFFIFECAAVLVTDFIYKSVSVMLNVHHAIALVGYTFVLFQESGHMFAAKGLILEMTTPFSALCWTLLKCGQEKSLLWKANQFILVHAFHCRSIIEMHLWYLSYLSWDHIYNDMPLGVFICLYIQLVSVTLVMTPYWAYKKTVQMVNPFDWNFEKDKDIMKNGRIKKTA